MNLDGIDRASRPASLGGLANGPSATGKGPEGRSPNLAGAGNTIPIVPSAAGTRETRFVIRKSPGSLELSRP